MPAAACCSGTPSTSGREQAAAVNARFPRRQSCATAARRRQQQQQRQITAAAADKPDWFRDLEESAPLDEAAARILQGANGNPDIVQQRMREEQDALYARIMGSRHAGEEAPLEVSFRGPVDQYNLWVWLELYRPPTGGDLEVLQEVISSWFLLGRLGGFNSTNLQVLYHQDADLEELEYEQEEAGQLPATFHDMSPLEAQGSWARFWLDMGTADELALDVLINSLTTFSREQLGIRRLVVGGQNSEWPVPQREEFLPEVTMDPMRGPRRLGRGGSDAGDSDDEDDDEAFLP